MTTQMTSKLFIPFVSQFKAIYQKARRSLKRRVESTAIYSSVNAAFNTDQPDCDAGKVDSNIMHREEEVH